MLHKSQVNEIAHRNGVLAQVAERDYILSHLVNNLALANQESSRRLVFKGGTALRMIYFNPYRYSADLDLTAVNLDVNSAMRTLEKAVDGARSDIGCPHLELDLDDALRITYIGPLDSPRPRFVKVDISTSEPVVETEFKSVHANLWPDLSIRRAVEVYTANEILAEKLRCVVQRMQCRDLYDIYQLLTATFTDPLRAREIFELKSQHLGLPPQLFAEKFPKRIAQYERRWEADLVEFTQTPEPFEHVSRLVRRSLKQLSLL